MRELINGYMTSLHVNYFLGQVLTILGLYILGLMFCLSTLTALTYNSEEKAFEDSAIIKKGVLTSVLMAFPSGLAMYVFVGYTFLTFSIPFNVYSISGTLIAIVILEGVILFLKGRAVLTRKDVSLIIVSIITCVIIGIASTSGKIMMSVSNDSLYYFWKYPRAIVYFGGLRDQFDNFLTDTGLGAAVIGTLPFIFGFGQTFGIQTFFHFNFILIFGMIVYEEVLECVGVKQNKKACVISTLSVALIAVCTPVYILSHWAMANMYFMEYIFIGFYLGRRMGDGNAADDGEGKCKVGFNKFLFAIFTCMMFACAQLRMEGGIFILLLVLIISFLNVDGKKFAITLTLIVALQTIYELKIFMLYTIDYPYTFLTPMKAVVQFAAYMALIIYLMFIRDKIACVIKKYLPLVLVVALVLANGMLCIMDSATYIGNLKAFYGNLFGQSGWGMLPYITIGSVIIIAAWEILIKKKDRFILLSPSMVANRAVSYWFYALVGFFLTALSVSFARGDVLDVNTGDSGNRVLLQIAPLVLIVFITYFTELLSNEDEISNE